MSDEQKMREDFYWPRTLDEAKTIVRSSPLFKKFISGTPLENDIAVWMTEFAGKLWVWKELETAIADSWVMQGKIKSLESELQAAQAESAKEIDRLRGVIDTTGNELDAANFEIERLKRVVDAARMVITYADSHSQREEDGVSFHPVASSLLVALGDKIAAAEKECAK